MTTATIAINNNEYAPISDRLLALTPIVPEPAILTANTYFWTPGQNASTRRRNEERNQQVVADYLSALGFVVTRSGDSVAATGYGLSIDFSYSESCSNVYKRLSVMRDGRGSNITAIRKIVAGK
jgi:hypothetical protein